MKKAFSSADFVIGRESRGGIIHIANIKGGVGKSTIATNLAAVLAKRGRTLIIDFDVQGNVSHALGFSGRKGGSSLLLSKKFSDFNNGRRKIYSAAGVYTSPPYRRQARASYSALPSTYSTGRPGQAGWHSITTITRCTRATTFSSKTGRYLSCAKPRCSTRTFW